MSGPSRYRRAPRGRPALGFQLDAPREVQLAESDALTCRERLHDGRLAGELEVRVFAAALIIDRDGILAEKAREFAARSAIDPDRVAALPVDLPGASGYRASAVARDALPYLHVFALAPDDLGLDGGLLVIVRAAAPTWPAADHILRSLRLETRHGVLPARRGDDDAPRLPIVG